MMVSTPISNIPDDSIRVAVLALDPEGGWDHETMKWPSTELWRHLVNAEIAGYVERSTAYGTECFRLTDEGMALRARMS